nr:hypothetical protein [Halocatena marina]
MSTPVDVRVNGGTVNGESHRQIAGTDCRESTSKPHPQGASGGSRERAG